MKVVTPGQLAHRTGSKYLGVLVAAKWARDLNELRRNELMEDPTLLDAPREKLTTISLQSMAAGEVEYRLTPRRRPEL